MKLDYATPLAPDPPDPELLTRATFCGIIPLIGGFGILASYLLFRFEVLPLLGLFWLPVGGIMVLVGGILLTCYLIQYLRSTARSPGTARRMVLIALLLFANLPAAWFCMYVGLRFVAPVAGD